MTRDDAVDRLAVELIQVLQSASIPAAIGGAIAFGYWGGPRGTTDVDLGVFVGEERFQELFDILQQAGCQLDRDDALRRARDGDVVIAHKDGVRIDVFVPSIPFHAEVERTVRQVSLRGVDVPVVSAEAITVLKLLFFRGKDIEDIKRLIALQGSELDHTYVRKWMVDMVGAEDERVEVWDGLVAEHGPGPPSS